jgi:hypothetical protein
MFSDEISRRIIEALTVRNPEHSLGPRAPPVTPEMGTSESSKPPHMI